MQKASHKLIKIILTIATAVLCLALVTGCTQKSPGEKLEGLGEDPRKGFIAKDVQEAALTEDLTPGQEALLSPLIFEGTIDKIDPTWIDRSIEGDKKIVTDLIIKVDKIHKGSDKAEFIVARNKQRQDSKKNVELFDLRFDNEVLFYVARSKDEFSTTTGAFSNYYVVGMYIVDSMGPATYDAAIKEIKRTSDLSRQEKLKELEGVPINKSVINELIGS